MNRDNETSINYLRTLANAGFWGTIVIKFEAGRIVHIRKEENMKPDELSERLRLRNEFTSRDNQDQ